jgi:hypothetical protein
MKRCPRKQLLLKLGVFLLLGVVVNVAVAWGFSLWRSLEEYGETKFLDEVSPDLRRMVPPEWVTLDDKAAFLMLPYKHSFVTGLETVQCASMPQYAGSSYDRTKRILHTQRTGWPMLTLDCIGLLFWRDSQARTGLIYTSEWVGGIDPPSWLGPIDAASFYCPEYKRPLPFRPNWPGFAINTIFYAAVLWLLWVASGKIRRFIIVRGRIRGHRCPTCGYQIAPGGGIGPVCSECGAALPQRLTL